MYRKKSRGWYKHKDFIVILFEVILLMFLKSRATIVGFAICLLYIILQSVDTAVEMNRAGDYGIPVPDYIEENVSSKVVKIIQSYTGVVNKMVWRKEV